jgi:four helix bundle protein
MTAGGRDLEPNEISMPHGVQRFEDLIAWQRARELTRSIYRLTQSGGLDRDFGLAGQMQRAAVSVMANIAEGHERGLPGDFHRFLGIAKGSCGELRSHLYAALDAGYVAEERHRQLRLQAEEVGRIIGGLQGAVAKRKAHSRREPPGSRPT